VQQQWPRSHTHRQALSQGSSNKCASFQTAFDVNVAVVVVVAVGVADVAAAPTNVAGCADVAANAAAAAAVAAAGVAAAAAACVERKKNTKPKNVARFASV